METIKYKTIVIDPPWTVKNNLTNLKYYRTGKKMPYSLMSDREIMLFPIENFAEDECDLFMWTITSKIPVAFEIVRWWGFKYMDFFAWDKQIGVPVNGVYRSVEWVIYAYKGKMGINKKGRFINSMFREKRGKHSRKPDLFYEVLRNNTKEPRVDIFARDEKNGWDAWGNEIVSKKEVEEALKQNTTAAEAQCLCDNCVTEDCDGRGQDISECTGRVIG